MKFTWRGIAAHVQGGGAEGEGGGLWGWGGNWGAAPVRAQLAWGVGAVGQRVRNCKGGGG